MNGKLSTMLSAEDHDSQEGVGAVLGVVVGGTFPVSTCPLEAGQDRQEGPDLTLSPHPAPLSTNPRDLGFSLM